MTVYWIRTDDDRADHVLEAIEHQLTEGDVGDPALAESLRIVREEWDVDPDEVLESKRPFFAPLIVAFRRQIQRLLWWYGLPQWGRVHQYRHATSRVVEALLAEQGALRRRIAALESERAGKGSQGALPAP